MKLPTLRRVISAGAPVLARVLDDVRPPARASRRRSSRPTARPRRCRSPRSAATRSSARPGTRPTRARASASAGRSRASRSKIIRISDDPIPTWSDDLEVARRRRSARSSSPGRSSPASTSTAPRRPPWPRSPTRRGGTFYHRMGDLGYRDDQGRLWFCGRKSHRVDPGRRDALHDPLRGRLQHPSRRRPHGPGRRRPRRRGRARALRRAACAG